MRHRHSFLYFVGFLERDLHVVWIWLLSERQNRICAFIGLFSLQPLGVKVWAGGFGQGDGGGELGVHWVR